MSLSALEIHPKPNPGLRERFEALLDIYALHTAPVWTLGAAVDLADHPAVTERKRRLEREWISELDARSPLGAQRADVLLAIRRLAARDRLPPAYRWIAKSASYPELVRFLALEGGPDGGFDDLVAACQIGLSGAAKLELATNFWDEMGNGSAADVHTKLHEELTTALGIEPIPRSEQPVSALARSALCGMLATNRRLQPEMLGALGLIELQAGPRCRLVLEGLRRVSAPGDFRFYAVHAEVDPRHGRDWLTKVIAPLIEEHPEWAPRILRGAAWRSVLNAEFLADVFLG